MMKANPPAARNLLGDLKSLGKGKRPERAIQFQKILRAQSTLECTGTGVYDVELRRMQDLRSLNSASSRPDC